MKNQFIKNTWESVLAVVALAALFVIAQSVTAAGISSSSGSLIVGEVGTVEKFQVSSTTEALSSLTGSTKLRIYGDSILAYTVITEDAHFIAEVNSQSPLATFNVGYESLDEPPSLASFQVNGGVRVSDLADASQPGRKYCLCADGYGELVRCRPYDPGSGLTCDD